MATIYAVTIPDEHPLKPAFPAETKFLSPAPDLIAPGATTYYISRQLCLEPGTYSILMFSDDTCTAKIGTGSADMTTIGTSTIGAELDTTFEVGTCDIRFELILQNIPSGMNNCLVVFKITRGDTIIYTATSADGWFMELSPLSDEDIGLMVPVAEDNPYTDPPFDVFTDGEKFIGAAEDMAADALTTFYFARYMPWTPGRYVIKAVADDALQAFIGRDGNSLRQILACTLSDGAVQVEFQVFEGEHRLDLYLHNTGLVGGFAYMLFSIHRDGKLIYASDAPGMHLSMSPVCDCCLADSIDPRLRMPVMSFLPNWKNGVTETLTWKTEMFVSEDAKEQRRALRVFPRRSIEASFLRRSNQRSRLQNFLLGAGVRRCLVPLWFEQVRLQDSIEGGSTSGPTLPDGALETREFLEGDAVLVTAGNPDVFNVAIIGSINPGTLAVTWSVAPPDDWPAGSRIIPLRKGRMIDAPTLSNVTDQVATLQVRFELEVDDQFDLARRDDDGSVLGVFPFKPQRSDAVELEAARNQFEADNGVADQFIVDPTEQPLPILRHSMLLFGRNNVYQFRRFLNLARGRARRFWMPTFTHDITIMSRESDGSLIVKPTGYWEFFQSNPTARQWIAIMLGDGTTTYHKIDFVVPLDLNDGPPWQMSSEQFYFDQSVPSLALSNVKRVHFVSATRFEQDTFELLHHSDNLAAVSTAVVVRSVDDAGMTDLIDFE